MPKLTLNYACIVDVMHPIANLVDPSEKSKDHPDAFFRVYESVFGTDMVELKVKCNRDGNLLHYLRVYKR